MEYAEWNMFTHMYFHFKTGPSPVPAGDPPTDNFELFWLSGC